MTSQGRVGCEHQVWGQLQTTRHFCGSEAGCGAHRERAGEVVARAAQADPQGTAGEELDEERDADGEVGQGEGRVVGRPPPHGGDEHEQHGRGEHERRDQRLHGRGGT